MPQGNQHDIDVANKVIDYLGIDSYEVNIDEVCKSLYNAIDIGYNFEGSVESIPQIASNSPARIRMAVLYAIAAREHGRVANTCNRSEDFIGLVSLTSLSLKRQKMVLVARQMKIILDLPMMNSITSYCKDIIHLMMFIRTSKNDISVIFIR